MESTENASEAPAGSMVCESCGTTHQDFKKGGRLGCDACYHVFRPILDPLLEGMHAGTQHLGKIPSGSESRVRFEQSVDQLKKELLTAIENEDFEKAAEFRDQLKILENEAKV